MSYIIYTHFHGDHTLGAKVFHTPTTKVIAQEGFAEELARMRLLLPYKRRVNLIQWGFDVKGRDTEISLTEERGRDGYIPPSITFDEEYRFEEGGLRFELYHTQGETFDHLMVWLPQEKVLLPGDLFYSSFPMLSNPMKPDRPVLRWAESLERMRILCPEYLVPSHTRPRRGGLEIDLVLANYAEAIRYVHDETVKGINQGLTLEQIRRQVQLPQNLARLPYLQQRYGTVEWAVNGIFRQYTGWFTLNPADLKPGARAALDRTILEACRGANTFNERARRALREGEDQLALELTDIVLGARPQNREARAIRAKALRRLGTTAKNGVERNIYLTAAGRLDADSLDLRESHSGGLKARTGRTKRQWETGSRQGVSSQKVSSSNQEGFRREGGGAWPLDPMALAHVVAGVRSAEPKSPSPTGPLKQDGSTAAINRWYDNIMYIPVADKRYGGSDFCNYGYWEPATRSLREACENLMERLLALIPNKEGTILDVACGKGAHDPTPFELLPSGRRCGHQHF